VFLGWSLASVAGMPLGAWVGAWVGSSFGWRAAFGVVDVMAAAGAAGVWLTLPDGLRTQTIDRAAWGRLLGNPLLLAVIAVTAIPSWAQFTLSAYFTPAFKALANADGRTIAVLLGVFGFTGLVGNVLAGRLIDRLGPARIVAASIAVMMAGHAVWLVSAHTLPGLVAALLLWGLGCFAANSAQQARLAGLALALAPVSIALNTSAIYLGQALGAETGGQLIARVGLEHLPWASLPIFAVSLGLSGWAGRRAR
jgi:predicted MFS family arabinose efflux permease